ncbi:MAG: folate-binding protein YgfZ [Usitatibacter sp.]
MSDWRTFLAGRGARLDAGGVAGFGDAQAEAIAARDATIVADLSHNALLAVSGDDAAAFLHGQLTNDVQALVAGGAQWTGWCSAKGRLLATFLLLRRANDFLLLLPAEIAPGIAKRLRMYVLRSRVKIEDAPLERIALAGPGAVELAARHFGVAPGPMASVEKDGATCIALDAKRFVILAPLERERALWDAFAQQARPVGMDAWEWTSIRAGIPIVGARTQEQFVPQMANFELVGGVSFKKGCYPGQEIVARTQYRGILKKRMAMAHVDGARPAPGDTLHTPAFGEQAAGMVVSAAPSPDGGHDLLAVAQIEGIQSGDLRVGSLAGERLRLLPLPYST